MKTTEWCFAPYPQNAPPEVKDKPWRVTAYRRHWYWGYVQQCFIVGDYRRYWQANAVNFIYHYVFGCGCNTWKKPRAIKHPPVKFAK